MIDPQEELQILREMNRELMEENEQIPFQVLERVGFPTNYIQLSLDQKFFVDCVFNNSRDIFSENLRMQDKIYHLEDKVADLQHELNNLAGE
jgi:hypothetical protein